jgi:hypothetical protein
MWVFAHCAPTLYRIDRDHFPDIPVMMVTAYGDDERRR